MNLVMFGIDQSDQMLYPSAHRKTLRWYRKAGINLLEIILTNLYRKFAVINKNASHLVEFWLVIIKSPINQQKMFNTKAYSKFSLSGFNSGNDNETKTKNEMGKCRQFNKERRENIHAKSVVTLMTTLLSV